MKQGELLHTQLNANGASSSDYSELIKEEQWENTPLWIRGNEEQGYFITIGNNRVSEIYKKKEEVKTLLETRNWNLMLTLMAMTVERVLDVKNEELGRELNKRKSDKHETTIPDEG